MTRKVSEKAGGQKVGGMKMGRLAKMVLAGLMAGVFDDWALL